MTRFFQILARHRYRDFSEVDIQVSEVTKQSYGEKQYTDIYGSDAWSSPNGQLLQQSVDWTSAASAKTVFPGKIYILEGAGTFSTAAIFTAAVQDSRVGTIMGDESGGLPTLYGELFSFTMPYSKLEGTVSTKFFVRPSGDRTLRGVIPDVRLTPSPVDAPSDPELTSAIQYAAEHS